MVTYFQQQLAHVVPSPAPGAAEAAGPPAEGGSRAGGTWVAAGGCVATPAAASLQLLQDYLSPMVLAGEVAFEVRSS
jgi:hypothetical protein